MALKAGSFIHTAHGTTLVERLQSAGPSTLNITTEKIYELGNYESVGSIRSVPDLTFSLESLDVSTDIERLLLDIEGQTDEGLNLAATKLVNLATQFKPGRNAPMPFKVTKSVHIPALRLESASYRFGLRDNASQTFSLRGDAIFYNQGAAYTDEAEGTGVAGQTITTSHPAYDYTDGEGTRRILAVVTATKRLTYGADYTLAEAAVANGAAIVTVTLTQALPVGDKVRVIYASPDSLDYPQSVHTPAIVKPAAVRGKDIDVYIGGYDLADVAGSAENRWTGVQAATVDWRVTLEKEEEFGNYYAVAQDFDIPTVSGTVDLQARDVDDLYRRLRQITGITSETASIGPNVAKPLQLDIVIKDGENGGVTLKRLSVKDARFSVPGYAPRPNSNVTQTLEWESDSGELLIFADRSAPRLARIAPATGEPADEVVIHGVNIAGVTEVLFGETPATSFTVDSNHQLTAVVPAGEGTVDVTIVTDKGTSAVNPAGEFTYSV